MLSTGILRPLCGGIQIDINAVIGEQQEYSLCNHNCTSELGNYDCPAAFTLLPRLKPSYASLSKILTWVQLATEGLIAYRNQVLYHHLLQDYFNYYEVPSEVQQLINACYSKDMVEVNLFGGNPEMHPEILDVLQELRSKDVYINFTTTGRKVLQNETFASKLLMVFPNILALSLDDLSVEYLKELLAKDLAELKEEWKRVPIRHGQAQKAIESIYTAKRYADRQANILFNVVVHSGNLHFIYELIEQVHQAFPRAFINPYPFQTSFEGKKAETDIAYLGALAKFTDYMLQVHTTETPFNFVKRLHYWMALKAVFDYSTDPDVRTHYVTGRMWKCYHTSTGYVQVGRGNGPTDTPGGKLGCFWNTETVTEDSVLSDADQISNYLINDRYNLSRVASVPCEGCIMPRLVGDIVSLEQGLAPELKEAYMQIRKQYLGY